MKRVLEWLGLGSLGVVMFVPLFAGVLFVAVLMGTLTVFSRSGSPKLTLSYPLIDERGVERRVTVTLTGRERRDVSEDINKMIQEGRLEADLSLFVGPRDLKLFETRLALQIPFQDLLGALTSSTALSGFGPGVLPPELQPLLAELQGKDLRALLQEANDPELKRLLGDNPERRFKELTGKDPEQAFMELLQQEPELVKQLLQKKDYASLLRELLKARLSSPTPATPTPPR